MLDTSQKSHCDVWHFTHTYAMNYVQKEYKLYSMHVKEKKTKLCLYKVKWSKKNAYIQCKHIIVKRGKMACVGKTISFCLQGQISSWQKLIYTGREFRQIIIKKKNNSGVPWWFFWAIVLSHEGEMTEQDTCCCCVTCHIALASRRPACKYYILFSSQQGKKWSWHNADSFWWEYLWNCCIKPVSDEQS